MLQPPEGKSEARIADSQGDQAFQRAAVEVLGTLKSQDSLIREIVAATLDSLVLLDTGGAVTAMNYRRADSQPTQIARDALWIDCWSITSREHAVAALRTAERSGVGTFEGTMTAADGTLRWWKTTVIAVSDARGTLERFVALARDVTPQRVATDRWSESETELRSVIASASDYAIFTTDLKGIVTSWWTGAASTFGYAASEILGKSSDILWTPEDRANGAPNDERNVAAMTGMADDNRWHLRKDGVRFYVRGALRTICNSDGALTAFVKICRDETKREESHDALALADAIISSSDDAIVSKTTEGIIRTWNKGAERIFGWSESEVVGKPILIIVPDDRKDEEPRILAKLRSGERVDHFETVRICKDGRLINVSVTISPIRDKSGKVIGASKIARDITEQKRTEQERASLLEGERAARSEAERLGRLKDEFLATLSHELRTPLNAILGWSQVMKRSMTEDDVSQGLDIIERNARAQNQIITDLLDMSRIISGKVRLDVRPLDLASLVESSIETVRPTAAAKGVRLVSVLDPLIGVKVNGDANRLQQVLWNLLSNAVKFTPAAGHVQVLLERVHSHIEIGVVDTGEGIRPEFLPYVFDRFRQADASTTRRHGGLGLGLSIVKQLVELHGGSVRAKSVGAGTGATFIVKLPLMSIRQETLAETTHPHHSRLTPTADATTDGPELTGLSILVVDDEVDARMLVKRLVEEHGAVALTAGSAGEALAMLTGRAFDVLVSDIGMPVQDGYMLISEVRKLPRDQGGGIPAIALTAYARAEDRIRAISKGFNMHVAKPVEPSELITMIAAAGGRVRG